MKNTKPKKSAAGKMPRDFGGQDLRVVVKRQHAQVQEHLKHIGALIEYNDLLERAMLRVFVTSARAHSELGIIVSKLIKKPKAALHDIALTAAPFCQNLEEMKGLPPEIQIQLQAFNERVDEATAEESDAGEHESDGSMVRCRDGQVPDSDAGDDGPRLALVDG